jgi:DNA-directed RNA polymerase specialized sigma24 family protein
MQRSDADAEPGGGPDRADTVLRRFGRPLLRYFVYLARDPQLAEELTRDSLLRAFGAGEADLASFPPDARAWLTATRVWMARPLEDPAAESARAVLWGVAVMDLGEREIAAALRSSPDAVASAVARARSDVAAREALRAIPEPELPVALARSVTLGLARAAKEPHGRRTEALPSLALPGAGRRIALAGAAVLVLALAFALFARLPLGRAPETLRSVPAPAEPSPAEEVAPPAEAEPVQPGEPAPQAYAPPTPDPQSVRADAPTLEDFAVIEVLDVLEALGDLGGGRG